MPVHLHKEIENLKKEILTVGAMAELSVREASRALVLHDAEIAAAVINKDLRLDEIEIEVEESCLKVLALHQPVAVDLRFIVAVLKINNDLERIGDLAVNIAENALFLADYPPIDVAFNFTEMSQRAQQMLKDALDALVNFDAESARTVLQADDDVDEMNRSAYTIIQKMIRKDPDHTEALVHVLSACRNLERIADHATNIAEDVIYMVRGEIVRHHAENYRSPSHL